MSREVEWLHEKILRFNAERSELWDTVEKLMKENASLKEEVKHLKQIEQFYFDLNNPENPNA